MDNQSIISFIYKDKSNVIQQVIIHLDKVKEYRFTRTGKEVVFKIFYPDDTSLKFEGENAEKAHYAVSIKLGITPNDLNQKMW